MTAQAATKFVTFEDPHGSGHCRVNEYTDGALYICDVVVPFYDRGKGQGASLMWTLVERAENEGLQLELHCMEALIPFYEKFGFQDLGADDTFMDGKAHSMVRPFIAPRRGDCPDAGYCEHGVFVGGSGRDTLCTECEVW